MTKSVGSVVRQLSDDIACIKSECGAALARLDGMEKWREKAMPEVMAAVKVVQRGTVVISVASVMVTGIAGMGLWIWSQDHTLLTQLARDAQTTAARISEEHTRIEAEKRINDLQQTEIYRLRDRR